MEEAINGLSSEASSAGNTVQTPLSSISSSNQLSAQELSLIDVKGDKKWAKFDLSSILPYILEGWITKREIIMNLRLCPLALLLQKISLIDNFPGDKAALLKIINEFLKKWSSLLADNIFQLCNSIELDQLLIDYDNFFKDITRVRKELQKHVEVSPIVVRKTVNVRSRLLHRNACLSALRLIIMSTLGGGARAKYDYESASIKSVFRTATGCADEESCAKVGIAVVQNTFVPNYHSRHPTPAFAPYARCNTQTA